MGYSLKSKNRVRFNIYSGLILICLVASSIFIIPQIQNPTVKAYDSSQYSLTLNIIGQGTVITNPSGPYNDGTVVTLTAVPSSGWEFSGVRAQ
jgi:hypothetical protein